MWLQEGSLFLGAEEDVRRDGPSWLAASLSPSVSGRLPQCEACFAEGTHGPPLVVLGAEAMFAFLTRLRCKSASSCSSLLGAGFPVLPLFSALHSVCIIWITASHFRSGQSSCPVLSWILACSLAQKPERAALLFGHGSLWRRYSSAAYCVL